MIISKFISAVTDKTRIIKATVFGAGDVRTGSEVAPAGVDGNPIAGMAAIYSPTSLTGQQVVIGYINVNQLADPGELRIYATDSNGAEKVRIWLHNDGTVELGGTGAAGSNTKHATQYEALKQGLDTYFTALNAAITAGVSSAGGSYTQPTPGLDITASKLDNILTE